MIIAIDGPAASGKSTVAAGIAKQLDITYLDTGSMYRAVTYEVIKNNIGLEDNRKLKIFLNTLKFDYLKNNGDVVLCINGERFSDKIRSRNVTENVSEVSAIDIVRKYMVNVQRHVALLNDCILEGRDIGTVVFPNADFKFFLVADIKSRAKRRLVDLKNIGEDYNLDYVINDIIIRDKKDSSRQNSPLKKAKDAIEIDTSNLTIEEVINKIIKTVKKGHYINVE